MPRAIPMGYGEQRYDAFVSDVQAFTADGQLDRRPSAKKDRGGDCRPAPPASPIA